MADLVTLNASEDSAKMINMSLKDGGIAIESLLDQSEMQPSHSLIHSKSPSPSDCNGNFYGHSTK